jgi:hypothetical protein
MNIAAIALNLDPVTNLVEHPLLILVGVILGIVVTWRGLSGDHRAFTKHVGLAFGGFMLIAIAAAGDIIPLGTYIAGYFGL